MASGDSSPGVVGQLTDSGRISGAMAAAPATTGAVNARNASSCRADTGVGIPGSSGAATSVGAAGVFRSTPWPPCERSGPADRRREEPSGTAAPAALDGVTLLPAPPRASVVWSIGADPVTPPSAIAASDTAPAATNANRRLRDRSSCRPTG